MLKLRIMSSASTSRSLKTNHDKSSDGSLKPGSGSSSKHESHFQSFSNGKTKQDYPSAHFTRAGSSANGRVLASATTNRSIKRTFSRASSAASCTQEDEELSALETLETLKFIVSSGTESSSYQIPQSVGRHSVLTHSKQKKAEHTLIINEENGMKMRQLSRHRSLPASSANVVTSQGVIGRSSARKTIATHASSSESRGTSQMVAFCETELLKACLLSTNAHSGAQTKHPAKSPGSPQIPWALYICLILCMLFVIVWTFFTFFYGS